MMIIEELKKFLIQSQTLDLRTQNYINYYNNCVVKFSFGKGRVSSVPWIAFLRNNNEIRRGIYPAILFYKNQNILVTSFAIGTYSDEYIDDWTFPEGTKKKRIIELFSNIPSNKIHYGNSYYHKVFEVNENIDFIEIQNSIDHMIDIYTKYNE